MKKLLALVAIVTVVFFFVANHYYDGKVKTIGQKAYSQEQVELKNQKEQEQQKAAKLTKNKNNSVIDWLKYLSLKKDNITLSILGSSVTAGAGASNPNNNWGSLLSNYLSLNVNDVSNINLINNGYGGYTTAMLINDKKISNVESNHPDVVIFELCLINNYRQNITISKTESDIKSIIEELHSKLPNTLIVLQTANTISSQTKNALGLTYDDYNQEIKNFVMDNQWNFINTYDLYKQAVNSEHLSDKDYLKDGIHPNDEGNKIWFNILKENLSKTSDKINF